MDKSEPESHDALVENKVRRRVAFKVMRDIHKQVEQIEEAEKSQHRAKRWLLPMLVIVCLFIIASVLWPDLLRQLSSFIF